MRKYILALIFILTSVNLIATDRTPAIINNEVIQELKLTKGEITTLKSSLSSARNKLDKSTDKVLLLNSEIAKQREWGIKQQEEAAKYFNKYNSAVEKLHLFKNIVGILLALLLGYIGFTFMGLIPPPYGFILPVAGVLVGYFFSWVILEHFVKIL